MAAREGGRELEGEDAAVVIRRPRQRPMHRRLCKYTPPHPSSDQTAGPKQLEPQESLDVPVKIMTSPLTALTSVTVSAYFSIRLPGARRFDLCEPTHHTTLT